MEGEVVLHLGFRGEHIETYASDSRWSAREVLIHDLLFQPDGLKNLCAP